MGMTRILGWSSFVCAGLLLGLPGVLSSCNSNSKGNKVSSSLFLTPVPDSRGSPQEAVRILATGDDFIEVNDPDRPPGGGNEEDDTTETSVLGSLDDDTILIFESRSGSMFSADIGRDFDNPDCLHDATDGDGDGVPDCERIKLHYNAEGLNEELRSPQSDLSSDVSAIRLQSGWVLAFERSSASIVAFRNEPPRLVPNPIGDPIVLPYRSTRDPSNLNFGRGNGVILSEVLSGSQLEAQTDTITLARFFEIEPNKVLLFFNTGASIHLLELSEVDADVDFDLDIDDPQGRDIQSVKLLQGEIKLFPSGSLGGGQKAFLTYSEIAAVTGNIDVQANGFPPVLIPSDGSALLFDASSNLFLRVRAVHAAGPATPIIGSSVRPGSTLAKLLMVLGGSFRPEDQVLAMNSSFPNPDSRRSEILIMEETTNNILGYDFEEPVDSNLRVFVTQASIIDRRNIAGQPGGIPDTREPELVFASDDIDDNRLSFDGGRDQLLSVSSRSGLVVVTVDTLDLLDITNQPASDLTYIQPLDDTTVRALDSVSGFLLSLRLKYVAIPVRVSQ